MVVASKSDFTLYDERYVTFGADDVYNQQDAEGFINLFTLSLKIGAIKRLEAEEAGKLEHEDKGEIVFV
jgi:argininosuccinate synthase